MKPTLTATQLRDQLVQLFIGIRAQYILTPDADDMVTHWLGGPGVNHPSITAASAPRMSTDPPEISLDT